MKKDMNLNWKIYDEFWYDVDVDYEPFLEVIENIIRKNGYKYIVDFGCGNGLVGKYLHTKCKFAGCNIIGVEISESAIEKSKPYYDKVEMRFDNKLPDGKYDMVVLNSIIEHIEYENLDVLFEDIKNKLNENGTVFIAVPNIRSPKMILFGDREKEREEMGHVNLKSKKGWIKYFKKFGFNRYKISFPIRLKNSKEIIYYPNNKVLNSLAKGFYNFFLLFPFYYLRDSFYFEIRR